jgi:hypothetical protein
MSTRARASASAGTGGAAVLSLRKKMEEKEEEGEEEEGRRSFLKLALAFLMIANDVSIYLWYRGSNIEIHPREYPFSLAARTWMNS